TPSGCSGDWSGLATKPSIDIVMFSFSLLIDAPSVDMLVGSPSASEVIGQARSLTKLATTRRRTSFRSRRSVVALLDASLRSGAVAPGHIRATKPGLSSV